VSVHRASLLHKFTEGARTARSHRRYVGTVAPLSGTRLVVVVVEDGRSYELPTRRDLAPHAQEFLWGEPGPGARQLALAILADALVDEGVALALHERFARVVGARNFFPPGGFSHWLSTVLTWVWDLEDT
jgi:Family of unknown function (DUF6166)